MALTNAQLQALKTYIASQPDLASQPQTLDGAYEIARLLNLDSTSIVWKRQVLSDEISKVVSYVAVAAMTTANLERVRSFFTLNPEEFDPTRADIRTFWADTFSGALGGEGANTRAALGALWKRTATRFESVYSGNGTTGTPATLVLEGPVTPDEVQQARTS
jgi:hypothetical protein